MSQTSCPPGALAAGQQSHKIVTSVQATRGLVPSPGTASVKSMVQPGLEASASVVPGGQRGCRDRRQEITCPGPCRPASPQATWLREEDDRIASCAQRCVAVLSMMPLLWEVGSVRKGRHRSTNPSPTWLCWIDCLGLWLQHTRVCRWSSPWYLGACPPCVVGLLSGAWGASGGLPASAPHHTHW